MKLKTIALLICIFLWIFAVSCAIQPDIPRVFLGIENFLPWLFLSSAVAGILTPLPNNFRQPGGKIHGFVFLACIVGALSLMTFTEQNLRIKQREEAIVRFHSDGLRQDLSRMGSGSQGEDDFQQYAKDETQRRVFLTRIDLRELRQERMIYAPIVALLFAGIAGFARWLLARKREQSKFRETNK